MFVSSFAVGLTVSETDDDIPLKKKKKKQKTDRLSGGTRFLIKLGNSLKNHDIKTRKKKKRWRNCKCILFYPHGI